jgi:regulator of protease activity HflC (stomatin/prohibitin superfamily)
LHRTTLRNIIGTLTLKSANSERGKINAELYSTLHTETQGWRVEIVRTELKQIDPPKDVQETMNKVVKAENEKMQLLTWPAPPRPLPMCQEGKDQGGRGDEAGQDSPG